MLNDKEHYELMEQFEKDYKGKRFDKEPKELWVSPITSIYQDGSVNELFLAYRKGYSLGKCFY